METHTNGCKRAIQTSIFPITSNESINYQRKKQSMQLTITNEWIGDGTNKTDQMAEERRKPHCNINQ